MSEAEEERDFAQGQRDCALEQVEEARARAKVDSEGLREAAARHTRAMRELEEERHKAELEKAAACSELREQVDATIRWKEETGAQNMAEQNKGKDSLTKANEQLIEANEKIVALKVTLT